MKSYYKICNGWEEKPNDFEDENVHALMSFRPQLCNIQCTPESTSSITFTLKLKSNEVEFQRDSDTRVINGLLCHLIIMTPYNTDSGPEYKLKIHYQLNDTHLEFIVPKSYIVFDDDELCPDNPEDLVSLILATQNELISEADQEIHAATVTPAQEQLKNLLKTLEDNKKLITASPITKIATTKIHLNLSRRGLCQPRIKEIRALIESKVLEYNNIILIVIKHLTIPDNFEIADGNQTMAAILEIKNSGKSIPSTLKCKIFERNQYYGALEIALNAGKTSKEHPLSYLEKVSVIRKELEKNDICRASVTKKKLVELKNLYNFLFPSEDMPRSLSFLISIPLDVFELCMTTSAKFTSGEICYSTSKGVEFCPALYKHNAIKVLNPDKFWSEFCRSYRQNAVFATNILNQLSLSYGIENALKEFKNTESDFQQQLHNSGIKFDGSLDDAIAAFNLPAETTQEQAHFLLANRSIQRQLTRQENFDKDKAKENISTFLKTVNNTIKFEHLEEISDLQNYQLIICFGPFEWELHELPGNCLILDLCKSNSDGLGQEIPVLWNIQLKTKKNQKPENGKLPLVTNQVRLFYLLEDAQKNAEAAYKCLQDKADEKSIEVGNYMEMVDIATLFKFCEDKCSCLFYEPPLEWIDIITSAAVNQINECQKFTILTGNQNLAARFKQTLSKAVTAQWQRKSEETSSSLKTPPRKRKRRSTTSVPPSPIIPSPVPQSQLLPELSKT